MKTIPNLDPALVEGTKSGLAALPGQIPGIVECGFGANNSSEGLTSGFDYGFTVDFVDASARDAYLPHPAHQAFVPVVRAMSSEVLVFDFEI